MSESADNAEETGAAKAVRELLQLQEQTLEARALLDQLQREVVAAENRLDNKQAAQLIEANEKLVLSALHAHSNAEASALALTEMSQWAEHDALTELPNRVLLLDRLAQAITHARRNHSRFALLFLDLNNFKEINDTLGHRIGDDVLKLAARCLLSAVRAADTVSRYGGDEFLILLREVSEPSDVVLIAEKVIAALATPNHIGDHFLRITASIGISIYPDDGEEANILIERADAAMYRAKRHGLGHFVFHNEALTGDQALDRSALKSPPQHLLHYELLHDNQRHPRYIISHIQNTAERKRSAAALKASELRHRSLFENMLEGYACCETVFEQDILIDFIYREVNVAFEKLTGLKNVIGKKVSEVIPGIWENKQELFEIYGRVALTGNSEKHEIYLEALETWFAIAVYSRHKDHFNVVFENITARKQAEQEITRANQELRQSNEKFHQLANHLTDAFWIRSPDMHEVQYVSPAFERIWGRSIESLYANPREWTNFILPEDRERVVSAFAALTENERSLDLEYRIMRPDGEIRWVHVRGFQIRDDTGQLIRHVGIVTDITQRKESEERLHHMAHYDALTGLPNRTLFFETLKKALIQAEDNRGLVAVLFLDVDHFKSINDTLGHAAGDELLGQISNRLVQSARLRDAVGRLGGDEFALILLMQDDQQGAWLAAKKMRDMLRIPFDLHGHAVSITASIGITIHPDDASDPETLLKYAATAMYQAKEAGRDTFRFFTAQMNVNVLDRIDLEMALRKAIENDEFVLHYQPKVQLDSGRIVGLEALLRWQRPGHDLVSPGIFIPVLEETGLIVRVGSWVVATVCAQIGLWMRSGIAPIQISVNVSGRQIIEGDLHGDVIRALADNNITPDLLELELTESSLMTNIERTVACLESLRALGVHISIDDFGTGYSSLAYLRRFPIDKLKIDIAFIRDITTNADDAAIALAIISMAHSLKLEVVAEGVETAGQLAYLRRHGCDQIQGYYFSPPLAVLELEKLLREEKCLPTPNGETRPLKTLLLVDDEANVLNALQRLLRQDGYHILSAHSAAEGFELLALHSVQVILCDQRMPTMNGSVFLDHVKNLYPDTIRIMLSGHTDVDSILDAINRGAIYRFYTKPWDNKVLRDNIREAFRHYWLLHDMPLET